MMIHYIATGLGGALGCMARLLASKLLPATIFGVPSAILFINILGCLVMGMLTEILALYCSPSENAKYFLLTGFLGGFTTFSAFSAEFALLFEKNELLLAFSYVALSVCLSLFFFFVGIRIVRLF